MAPSTWPMTVLFVLALTAALWWRNAAMAVAAPPSSALQPAAEAEAMPGPGHIRSDGAAWTPIGLPTDAEWARQYDRDAIDDNDDPRLADETGAWTGKSRRKGASSEQGVGDAGLVNPPAPVLENFLAAAPRALLSRAFSDRQLGWWATWLPRVDVVFATARTNTRREVQGLVLLTFSVGGQPAGASAVSRALLAGARRLRTVSAAGGSAVYAPEAEDEISREERAALVRVLEEETTP